ncbi:MAG: hypothetical protein RBR97_16565 [Bacteroidales bacterium]|nr:hypothetical protein [Bacteroidales bacterium]
MTRNIIILAVFLLISLMSFSQSNEKNNNLSLELNAGKIFSPYRFYKNHTGYENIALGVSKNITEKTGVLLSQSYGRIFNETTNNRTLVMTTTVNPYLNFFTDKKLNLRIAVGTGLLYLYTKCLYDIYPISEHIYGMPLKLNLAVFYNFNDKLALNINLDTHYSFLFYENNQLIINDPYYYKTFFNSANIGVSWSF